MIRGLLKLVLVLVNLALPAAAEVARVKSGEHADFTRLVIEAPGLKDWSFGRRTDGYELQLDSQGWQYDVSDVFDLIPRKRLASIADDPDSGRLRLGIACPCHAIPFEFRPGVIVIDLRDGPAPPRSSFEQPLDEASKSTDASTSPRPAVRPDGVSALSSVAEISAYNWLDTRSTARTPPKRPLSDFEMTVTSEGDLLDPLRQTLLAQMSIGLSNGLVDLAEPGTGPEPAKTTPEASDWSRVILGEVHETTANLDVPKPGPLTPDGGDCIPDERLAVHDWGHDGPVSGTIGEIRQGLLGEFDRPDQTALISAAKSLIYLGFGVEARQLLEAFPMTEPQPDLNILLSLARLVDGQKDSEGPFARMGGCDSTAALWAALSSDIELSPGNMNDASLRRGFSALPPHLRRAVGPGLIERFLAADNQTAVLDLREAIDRGHSGKDPTLSIIDARIGLANGRPEEAEARAAEVLADPGPATADAVLALVDAQTTQNEATDIKTVTAIEALLEEQDGTAREAALRRALVLARFGAGDVPGAFAALADAPWASEEVWTLLAERGGDSDILALAVLPDDGHVEVPSATGEILAERLLGLGLAEPALRWLGQPDPEWDAARHLLYGHALLAVGKAKEALATVADQATPESAAVTARALSALGMDQAAAPAFDAAGNPKMAAAARGLANDWIGLAEAAPQDWQAAALRLTTGRMAAVGAGTSGALSRGADLVSNSEADRSSVEALLRAVPMPVSEP